MHDMVDFWSVWNIHELLPLPERPVCREVPATGYVNFLIFYSNLLNFSRSTSRANLDSVRPQVEQCDVTGDDAALLNYTIVRFVEK